MQAAEAMLESFWAAVGNFSQRKQGVSLTELLGSLMSEKWLRPGTHAAGHSSATLLLDVSPLLGLVDEIILALCSVAWASAHLAHIKPQAEFADKPPTLVPGSVRQTCSNNHRMVHFIAVTFYLALWA